MNNTATQHIEALLVNDGREFAMIRKADLAVLLQIAKADPHQGRFLDPLAAHKAEIDRLNRESNALRRIRFNQMQEALKHGAERRRYMANNKALLARVAALEDWAEGIRVDRDRIYVALCAIIDESSSLEAKLLRVARFKRKFPAIGALMDATP